VRVGPSICFEAIRPGWFNGLVREGAEVLVNLTDDSWFIDGVGPAQHLEMTRLRAVETRRWLVRASNSGISAIIDPSGEIVASLPFGTVGVLDHRIGLSNRRTPYVLCGDWIIIVSAITAVAAIAPRCRRGAGQGRNPG
jgi:apolipoprotein N-acyltransferase